MEKKILDVTCGSRSIWFNKHHPAAVYCDKREESMEMAFGRAHTCIHTLDISPDVLCDFTDLPFHDSSFQLVVFAPPHFARERNRMARQKVRETRRILAANAA